MENLKYVSPGYQARLQRLAELLCTPQRLAGAVVVAETVDTDPTLFEAREDVQNG